MKLAAGRASGWKRVPDAAAGDRVREHVRPAAARDHAGDAAGRRHLGRDDLRAHPARAEPARRRRVDVDLGEQRVVAHLAHELGARHARVARVDPVLIGQQHEQPRAQQHCDLGGERVVVAEGDLVGRGRVVLVDDRDDAPAEHRLERRARVQVARARVDVGRGQEHLARRAARPRAAPAARLRAAGPAPPPRPPAAPARRPAGRARAPRPRARSRRTRRRRRARPASPSAAISPASDRSSARRGRPRGSTSVEEPSLTTTARRTAATPA